MSDRVRAGALLAAAALTAVLAAACKQPDASDAIEEKCAPYRARELACADGEMKQALAVVGDICQKALNGKNPHVFGPASVKRIERDLECAIETQDKTCADYRACKAARGGNAGTARDDDGAGSDGSGGGAPAPVPVLPR